MKTLVVALGGNALLQRGEALTVENQYRNIDSAVPALARLAQKYRLAIVHGNGPKVGLLSLQQGTVTGTTGVLRSVQAVDLQAGAVDAILGGADFHSIQIRERGFKVRDMFYRDVGVPTVGLSIIARDVNRSSPCPSLPSAIRSGDALTATMTASNWMVPALFRWTNIARSRLVKVAWLWVMVSRAIDGLASIFSPFRRAISRCSSARSISSPCSTIREAAGPILCWGSRSIPCAPKVR